MPIDEQTIAKWQPVIKSMCIGGITAIVFSLIAAGYNHLDENASSREQGEQDETVGEAVNVGETAGSASLKATQAEHIDAYAWTVRVRLEALGILRNLRVATTANGRIVVSGNLLPTRVAQFEEFKRWYAAKRTFPELVDEVGVVKLGSAFPRIRSVWLAEQPSIHLENGAEARIGSIIGDGWKVIAIGPIFITVERNGTVIELPVSGG